MAQSVELLLKERLRREHWSLIYRNIESAGSPNAFAVTFEEAKKRLSRVANVELSEKHIDAIDDLADTRNRLQHFEVNITFEQVVGQINAAIDFLVSFLQTHLDIDIKDLIPDQDQIMRCVKIAGTI